MTIDPPESMDLDQALHLERHGKGFRVRYAIADVAAFVTPGGPMDVEAHERGQTLYAPDANARLYPPELSEGAGSLLPDETRPAILWTMDLDETGEGIKVDVRRALVRSREKLDYDGVQRSLDDGSADESLQLLREVGLLRQEREARQGGVQLAIPEQEVEETANGYELSLSHDASRRRLERADLADDRPGGGGADAEGGARRPPDAAQGEPEGGRAAAPDGEGARGRVGARSRPSRTSSATLDPKVPAHAAFLVESTVLLRGSGYAAFDDEVPSQPAHAGVGAPYAHATAPLRRLVDRYVGEVCVAVCAGQDVPEWATAALPGPAADDGGVEQAGPAVRGRDHLGGRGGRAEAEVGETFDAVVVEVDEHDGGGTIQLTRAGRHSSLQGQTCRSASASRCGSSSRTWPCARSASSSPSCSGRRRARSVTRKVRPPSMRTSRG